MQTKVSLNDLESALSQKQGRELIRGRVLALDPGETIGWAFFYNGKLGQFGQVKCINFDDACSTLVSLIGALKPKVCVIENYQVYAWKANNHSWSTLFTPRVIGATEFYCWQRNVGVKKQTAHAAKSFVSDDKLKDWGLWAKGKKHACDAIRHGVYFHLFPKGGPGKQVGKDTPDDLDRG